ncbi:bactofilin family protein [Cohnella thermotolerans]|uniref:bactofilin family protein n=1 Tax=Cohnella thermotolerans TaxID=329858 RepID=UPI00040F2B03|nr:polymer-forming cytoskeletal protein [Cohnella thermotolerans]
MFAKKTKIDPGMTDTLIGEGSTFEGKIKSRASIRLEGEVTGDVDCEGDVIIGENGVAKSNVSARNIVLAGKVHGNVTAKGKLTIKSTGHLFGNLSASELTIESGGFFQGMSKMEDKESAAKLAQTQEAETVAPSPSSDKLNAASPPYGSGSGSAAGANAGPNINVSDVFKAW